MRQHAFTEFEGPRRSLTTFITCLANSLVGVTMRAQPSSEVIILSITGIAKAPVLPVPVEAEPKRSFPPRIKGIA